MLEDECFWLIEFFFERLMMETPIKKRLRFLKVDSYFTNYYL